MRRTALAVLVIAAAAACFAASTTSAASGTPRHVFAGTPYQHLISPNGAVNVQFKVQKFVRQGKNGLAAVGQAVTTYQPSSGGSQTTTRSFKATVLLGKSGQQSNAVCPVLFLSIQKLSLVLLGLHVDLDKVVLTITANSKGGVLGSLFCQIAKSKVKLLHSTGALNKVASSSGLATTGLNFNVPVSGNKTDDAAQAATCQVLDLVLGPVNLNLLGLMVNLNQVHLSITADPNGGVLGSLFCSLTH
jgi:hypothetical protein